ncbi:MAG: ATP-binding protein, partial [Microthrixaceae bacterium]
RTTGELLDDLDAAIDAGLVLEDPDLVGRFRFSHALVADALVAELSASRRARVHAATARALEDLRIASLDQHLAEVAHHALAGALAGTAELAQRYSDLAAERAERIGAFEDEAQHRATALRALELARPGDRQARYAALVRLGVSRRHSDDAAGAISAFADAIAVAEELGDLEAMARAAVLLNEPSPWQSGDYGSPNTVESAVVERVLERLPDTDSTVRAELLGALAAFSYYRDPARSDLLSHEAVEMARRLDDPVTLIRTLNNRAQALWRVDSRAGRTQAAEEMVELASRHRLDPELQFLVELTRMVSDAETGASPRRHMEHVRQLALASGSSRALNQLGWFEAALLSIEGRDTEAIAVGAATFERYRRTRRWSAEVIHFGFVIVAHIDAGRGEQLLASAAGLPMGDYGAAFVGFAAWALQELGQPEAAREVLGPAGTVAALRDDWMWLGANTVTALAVAEAGDVEAAALLLARLEPYAGAIAVLGTNIGVPATDQALGRLHALLGHTDLARTHLDAAIELERRIGAVAWWSRALIARAELLADSTDPADVTAARADLAQARAAAEAHRLVPVIDRLDRLDRRASSDGTPVEPQAY